jgi:hypothetical protein
MIYYQREEENIELAEIKDFIFLTKLRKEFRLLS